MGRRTRLYLDGLFRRLARDYERLPATLTGLHLVAFSALLHRRAADFAAVLNDSSF